MNILVNMTANYAQFHRSQADGKLYECAVRHYDAKGGFLSEGKLAEQEHNFGPATWAFYTTHEWISGGNILRHNFVQHAPEATGFKHNPFERFGLYTNELRPDVPVRAPSSTP